MLLSTFGDPTFDKLIYIDIDIDLDIDIDISCECYPCQAVSDCGGIFYRLAKSCTARARDFRRLLDMGDGTDVMRAVSLVLPRDDGEENDSPCGLPDSAGAIADGVMQASCTVAPHHKYSA